MFTITTNNYIEANEVALGQLFEWAGGIFVRIKGYDDQIVCAICVTTSTTEPFNDGRLRRGDETQFLVDCPIGEINMEVFRQPTPDVI